MLDRDRLTGLPAVLSDAAGAARGSTSVQVGPPASQLGTSWHKHGGMRLAKSCTMGVQHVNRGPARKLAACWLSGALLVACGGRTLQDGSGEEVSLNETALEAAGTTPGALPSASAQPSVATGAGGVPGATEPATASAGATWSGAVAGASGTSDWHGVGGTAALPPVDGCSYPSFPEPGWTPPDWVPLAAANDAPATYARNALIGSWRGVVHTPWTTPYLVELTFAADGHYSASTPELGDCAPAFYYGTDDDTPLKQWRVENTPGVTSGEIDIAFDYRRESGEVEYGLPAWQGQLSAIERDASGAGLRFEFSTSTGYGPLRFDLRRVE